MKYRTESSDRPTFAQTFDELIDEWKFSEVEGKPVIAGQINTQKMIQQYGDCALSKILDRFLPEERETLLGKKVVFDDSIVDERGKLLQTDLDDLTEIIDMAEDMRERYGLSETMPIGQVFQTVQNRANTELARLSEYNKHKEVQVDGNVTSSVGHTGQVDSAASASANVSQNDANASSQVVKQGGNEQ